MITYLKVPYSEKDDAKKLGARWNPEKKTWYVENVNNLLLFKRWIPELKNYNNKDVEEVFSTETKKTFAEWMKIIEEENAKEQPSKKSKKLTKSQKKEKKELLRQKSIAGIERAKKEKEARIQANIEKKKNKLDKPIIDFKTQSYTTIGIDYIETNDDSIPWL